MELFDDAVIRDRVITLWSVVFQASNTLIVQANMYGFELIEVVPDPNIHQMLMTMKGAESLLSIIIDNQVFGDLHYDDARKLLNAREQLRSMQEVAIALKANDGVGFDVAIAKLEAQAPC